MPVCPISDPALNQDINPATPDDLFCILGELGIEYHLYHHQPLYTVADGIEIERNIPGGHCRNLFVRDRKETMFLVTALNETLIDLKKLGTALNAGRLSFGSPERLMRTLGVKPGSVCPFAILNDRDHQVRIVLDAEMMKKPLVNYHPLLNTMTIGVTPADLMIFLRFTGHEPLVLDMIPLAPDA